jgi:hypothetical protein
MGRAVGEACSSNLKLGMGRAAGEACSNNLKLGMGRPAREACSNNLKLGIHLSICPKTGQSQEMFVGIVVQCITLGESLRTSKRTQSVSITNINNLSSFREIIVDCSENLV